MRLKEELMCEHCQHEKWVKIFPLDELVEPGDREAGVPARNRRCECVSEDEQVPAGSRGTAG